MGYLYFLLSFPIYSSVFTCIWALGTPAERGPSLESIYRVSLTVDLCEGNEIISFFLNCFTTASWGPLEKKKNRGPWARAQCAHWLRRPCLYAGDARDDDEFGGRAPADSGAARRRRLRAKDVRVFTRHEARVT